MASRSAVIVGAGGGAGAAIARRFARGGFAVALTRRDVQASQADVAAITGAGGRAAAYGVDAADEAGMAAAFQRIESDLGPLGVVVFNAAAFLAKPALETSVADLEGQWRTIALGGFIALREGVKRMLPRGEGTLLVTGATAALRGGKGFAAFAAAKHALRATAQSFAREFGPQGLHAAHVVVDGIIDGPRLAALGADLRARKGADGLLDPDAIAEAFWAVHAQPRSAWTFELDVRPWSETW